MMDKESLRQLKYDVKKVLDTYPGLAAHYEKEIPTEIYGKFVIEDKAGVVQGDFDIKVRIPAIYPKGFPTLYETSEKIKRIDDRHIDKVGGCCVEITQRILQISRNGISLQDFFMKYVYKFFCWQLLYEVDPISVAQWDHGDKGVKQFYYEVFGCRDNTIIRDFITAVLNNRVPDRKAPCICGSGKLTKKCHAGVFFDLQQIGIQQLTKDLRIFIQQG